MRLRWSHAPRSNTDLNVRDPAEIIDNIVDNYFIFLVAETANGL
jgi:hypothetical protein